MLATVDGGHDLIRELELPFARLIVVYNTESFLNHSQVHPGNRRLARALLRYGLADAIAAGNEAPVAAVVRKIAKTETAAREEFDMLRFLKVFPLNVIVIHSFVLLLLFLYSRWPHTGPPLENQGSGNREFLEHIRALGARLSRTTPRMKALEPLLRYKQKTTGRDYTAIIEKLDEASAGKSSPENPQTPRRRRRAPESESSVILKLTGTTMSDTTQTVDVQKIQAEIGRLREEIAKVYVGQEELITGTLAALFAGGHVMIEGVPGLGKTLLVRILGVILGCNFFAHSVYAGSDAFGYHRFAYL